jgi:LAO/AO transport system kinase
VNTAPGTPHRHALSVHDAVAGVLAGDRTVLGRAISLIESSRAQDQEPASELLHRVLAKTGGADRVGVTGVPGAGKSTFIERAGLMACEAGRRVAVLAVDPSSAVSGGSILGDRTRMTRLSGHPSAFIRPSPSSGALGGVARRTRETMLLCEAAGFDTVLIETVGVGQSEAAVAQMCDCFLLLAIPGAGDDLQGMKRGVLELIDAAAVNKADAGNEQKAKLAAMELAGALHVMRGDSIPVLTCSALTGAGVADVWAAVTGRIAEARASGELTRRRHRQELAWLETLVAEGLRRVIDETPAARAALALAEERVQAGTVTASAAARAVLDAVRSQLAPSSAPSRAGSMPSTNGAKP